MKNEGKIIELLKDMLNKHDLMIEDIRGIKNEFISINLQLENTASILRITDLENRVSKLEKVVYK